MIFHQDCKSIVFFFTKNFFNSTQEFFIKKVFRNEKNDTFAILIKNDVKLVVKNLIIRV